MDAGGRWPARLASGCDLGVRYRVSVGVTAAEAQIWERNGTSVLVVTE